MVPTALLAQCHVMTAVLMTVLLIAYGRMVRGGANFGQAGALRFRAIAAGSSLGGWPRDTGSSHATLGFSVAPFTDVPALRSRLSAS